MEALIVPAAVVAGGLLAVQAGANAQLSKAVGSPFGATTIQLAIGTLVLALVGALTGGLVALAALPAAPWWHAISGIASAFYVVSTILLFPRLGALVSVSLFIAGQMLASLGLDAFGLLGVPAKGLETSALLGTLIVLVGAGAIVIGQEGGGKDLPSAGLGWIALALLAGAVLPVQGAINALLRQDLGAPSAVGAVSFSVATLAMVVVLMAAMAFTDKPKPKLAGVSAMPWWGWLGGFAGATYVTTVFTSIPVIGTAAAIGLTVAGQQVASVFVDRHGWFRLPRRPVSGLRHAGVALLLVGVALIKGS